MENISVVHCLEFAHILATILETYYIFNVTWYKSVNETLTVFQKYVTQIDCKTLQGVQRLRAYTDASKQFVCCKSKCLAMY